MKLKKCNKVAEKSATTSRSRNGTGSNQRHTDFLNRNFTLIKTPRDDTELFSLNRSKLKRIFNAHSWRLVDGQKVITFKELIGILKRLDIYPQCIAHYELRLILSKQEADIHDRAIKNMLYKAESASDIRVCPYLYVYYFLL